MKLSNETAMKLKHFNWNIDSFEEVLVDNNINIDDVTITDADLHRIFFTVGNNNAEMDVDGNIELL